MATIYIGLSPASSEYSNPEIIKSVCKTRELIISDTTFSELYNFRKQKIESNENAIDPYTFHPSNDDDHRDITQSSSEPSLTIFQNSSDISPSRYRYRILLNK
jgi:hypothetical protein